MLGADEFAARMERLGPFEPHPTLAVAVSGGADSLSLALLADRWARDQGGRILALIVDHALRDASAAEAALTADRLAACGIAHRTFTLTDLPPGSGLAERARQARYRTLTEACAAAGIVHLLLGHHLADQAETLLIRALGGSTASGLAAMAPRLETSQLRLLRPLLDVPPGQLRAYLGAAGIGWVEDPSNRKMDALLPRLRTLRADREGVGSATFALAAAAAAHAAARGAREREAAIAMARTITVRPEGFAVLPHEPIPPDVFAALVRTISGAAYPADTAGIAALAGAPRPATLAGIRLIEANWAADGRVAVPSLLMLREEAAIAADVAAVPGAIWDGRYRVRAAPAALGSLPEGLVLGKLGDAAARFRRGSNLPSAVLRTLPALWHRPEIGAGVSQTGENAENREKLVAVPHLGYGDGQVSASIEVVFAPPRPAAPASFTA